MMIAGWWILAGWVASLDAVVGLIAGRFGRVEPPRRVGAYLRGLLTGLERKNGWTLAKYAGAVCPDGMQRLLRTADWDVEGVRDDLHGYVLDALRDPGGLWVLDETKLIKKGIRSAGVARQYTGTSGKIDNCQKGVRGTAASRTRGLKRVLRWFRRRRRPGRSAFYGACASDRARRSGAAVCHAFSLRALV